MYGLQFLACVKVDAPTVGAWYRGELGAVKKHQEYEDPKEA
jgi:hypothetical protein